MLVTDILIRGATSHPERPALWHAGEWRSYGQLLAAASSVSNYLTRAGVAPGDRVAILQENSPEYIIAHFGTLMSGAVEVSLNTELTSPGIRQLLQDCEARLLFAGNRYRRHWQPAVQHLSGLAHLVIDKPSGAALPSEGFPPVTVLADILRDAAGPHATEPNRTESDLASIIYTSGSTGRPKGVMLSHRNLTTNTQSIVEYLGLLPEDRMLVVLPFHYVYGRSLLYSHFLSGGSILLENRFAFPMVALDTMEQQKATAFAGVPSTFSILLHKTNVRERRLPCLRLVTQAGGGMAPHLQQEVARAFAPASLYVMYGATEAAPRLSYVEPSALPRKWGSIGKAIPGVELQVVDPNGAKLPQGQVGEIAAKGPNIMLGYWKDPEGTEEVLRHGYYYTGDLGYEDEEGFIFLTGRARDIIKAGGNRVGAKEIEDTLLEIPGVQEAAVIGVPDDILGEAIQAFVVRGDPMPDEQAIRTHLHHRLADYKQPKFIVFRESLPKNESGKILKPVLRTEG